MYNDRLGAHLVTTSLYLANYVVDGIKLGHELNQGDRDTPSREQVHIPPNGIRKNIDSKVPLRGDMLVPRRVNIEDNVYPGLLQPKQR